MHFTFQSQFPVSAPVLFNWHKQQGALERLMPPWQTIKVLEQTGDGIKNSHAKILAQQGLLKIILQVQHFDYIEGRQFKDKIIRGPFKQWEHTHTVEPIDEKTASLVDSIKFELPISWLLKFFFFSKIQKELNSLFTYRHRVLKEDLLRHQGVKKMKILISGSSGLVGSALVPFLKTGGHDVYRLVREKENNQADEIYWDPENGTIPLVQLEGFDAVIHLSGESIMGRWTAHKKQEIRDSRVKSTQILAEALSQLKNPPKVLISGSAVGFYGNRQEEILTEQSGKGEGFLSDVCQKWEAATQKATDAGIRVVHLRTGTVLSSKGGALKSMLAPFKLCLGGEIGDGKQYMSWISMDDLIYLIHYLLQNNSIVGPVNATAPVAVRNREFTQTLGTVLKRPTFFRIPSFLITLIFGEMGQELLLSSQRVEPKKALESGFKFSYPDLEQALRHLLPK